MATLLSHLLIYLCISMVVCVATTSSPKVTLKKAPIGSEPIPRTYTFKGENALIECFSGENSKSLLGHKVKTPIYWWYDSSGKLIKNRRKAATDSGALVVRTAQLPDTGFYECQISSPDGQVHQKFKHHLIVFSYPEKSQNSTLIFSPKVCNMAVLRYKLGSVAQKLCQGVSLRKCHFLVTGKCITMRTNFENKNRLVLTVKSMVRNDNLLKHQECKGGFSCAEKIFKEDMFKQSNMIDQLAKDEYHNSNKFGKYRMKFISITKVTTTVSKCDAGLKSSHNSICVACRPGTYSWKGDNQCHSCRKNTYAHGYAKSRCTRCQYGHVTKETGAWGIQACIEPKKTRSIRSVSVASPEKVHTLTRWSRISVIGASMGFIVVAVVALACCAGKEKSKKEPPKKENAPAPKKKSKIFQPGPMVDPNRAYSAYSMPASMSSLSDVFYEDIEIEQMGFSHKKGSW